MCIYGPNLECPASSLHVILKMLSSGGDEHHGHQYHACVECRQPVVWLATVLKRVASETYLDARTASQATLKLEESTADLVLHRRSALVVVNRSSAVGASCSGVAEHSSTGLCSSGSSGGDSMTVRAGWSTTASAEDGATRGRVTVSSCKRHVGCFLFVCM
jgi:hypothetical protein